MDTSINDVIGFIAGHAEPEDISSIQAAIKTRHLVLKNQRQAEVSIGDTVETMGLSPKYLNNLVGTLVTKGSRSTILLDRRSTTILKNTGRKRFYIPQDAQEYELSGIPAGCFQSVA